VKTVKGRLQATAPTKCFISVLVGFGFWNDSVNALRTEVVTVPFAVLESHPAILNLAWLVSSATVVRISMAG
jgi:hypothetical protein